MKFQGEKIRELREQRIAKSKVIEKAFRTNQYEPRKDMLDRLVAEKIEAVQTIRDEFTKHVQDAPVNLNYLVTKENFCPDWKKLKSTQFKMDVLEVTESDINMHVISYKTEGKNNDSIEFLL